MITTPEYVAILQRMMRLRDHTIHISEDAADEENAAEVESMESQAESTLSFAADFEDMPEEDRRYFVTHELLHIHMLPFFDVVDPTAKAMSPADAFRFRDVHEQAEERVVDAIARAIAPLLPLPSECKKPRKRVRR